MRIKKIAKMENVGPFKKYTPLGEAWGQCTVIYGPNGHGKSTLAAVFRSLQQKDGSHILERQTLGATTPATVNVITETSTGSSTTATTFNGKEWLGAGPTIEIFDATFVSDNVYTGDTVSSAHRQNLLEIVIGEREVAVSNQIKALDTKGRDLAATISAFETAIENQLERPFSLDTFIQLQPIADAAVQLQSLTTQLHAARTQQEVLARPNLASFTLPALPAFRDLLLVCPQRLSQQAQARVQQHLASLGAGGEGWLRNGISHAHGREDCPLCGQPLAQAELMKLYNEYFSNAYREQVVALERCRNELEAVLGEAAWSAFQKRVMQNQSVVHAWQDLTKLDQAQLAIDQIEQRWRKAHLVVSELLRRKLDNPTLALQCNEEVTAALADYDESRQLVEAHKAAIQSANLTIGEIKKRAASATEQDLMYKLRQVGNAKLRHTDNMAAKVDNLVKLRAEKAILDKQKAELRAGLSQDAKKQWELYQDGVNRWLKQFGANFEVVNAKASFPGGKPNSSYQLKVNNIALDLGDAKTPKGTPCFRTALSTGDKHTLAMAFFLTKLESDGCASKVVIIDDPMSSLDTFRRTATLQALANVAKTAGQLILLSHDQAFLAEFEHYFHEPVHALELRMRNDGPILDRWEIAEFHRTLWNRSFCVLKRFVDNDDSGHLVSPETARSETRLYLEDALRTKFPASFTPTDTLGSMCGKIREAPIGNPLHSQRGTTLAEFDALNEYTNSAHHASRLPTTTEAEARAYVQRAIRLVQGSR